MIKFREHMTWDEVQTFDDIPGPKDIKLIEELEKEDRPKCPYLRKIGKTWHYCGIEFKGKPDEKPSPSNPVYKRHIGIYELQLFCLSDHDKCAYKSGKMKHSK